MTGYHALLLKLFGGVVVAIISFDLVFSVHEHTQCSIPAKRDFLPAFDYTYDDCSYQLKNRTDLPVPIVWFLNGWN